MVTNTIDEIVKRDHVDRNTARGRAILEAGEVGYRGSRASSVLRITSAVVDGETITIGSSVYEFKNLDQDTGFTTANNEWNNTTSVIKVTMTAHGFVVGKFLNVDSELFQITSVQDANVVGLSRGIAGTTIAVHADAATIRDHTAAVAGNVIVPLPNDLSSGTAGISFEKIVDVQIGVNYATTRIDTVQLHLVSKRYEDLTTACSETMGGATNDISSAFEHGRVAGLVRLQILKHRVTARDVTIGLIVFHIDFAADSYHVEIRPNGNGQERLWDGTLLIDPVKKIITMDNANAVDWVSNDEINLWIAAA